MRNYNAIRMLTQTRRPSSAHLCPARQERSGRAGTQGWSSPPRPSSSLPKSPKTPLPLCLHRSRAQRTWTSSSSQRLTKAAAPTSTSRVAPLVPPSPVPPTPRLPHQCPPLGPPMPLLVHPRHLAPLSPTRTIAVPQLVRTTRAADLIALRTCSPQPSPLPCAPPPPHPPIPAPRPSTFLPRRNAHPR